MVQITVVGIWCTLVKDDLEFELKSSVVDIDGRWILMDATVQGSDFFIRKYLYIFNRVQGQCTFFGHLDEILEHYDTLTR